MQKAEAVANRTMLTERVDADLVVVGGGLAGTCGAIAAARAGLKVALVQDRPVLGGNASSEVRLWVLGATSHMGNNNRWAREGGVVDEVLVENMYRNPEGNPLIFDTILLEKVHEERNITLLLNTVALEATKADADTIASVRAFCSQNSTFYEIHAPLFCDASGDGVLGFLTGAAFRMGAEGRDEFDEGFAPSAEYGELLGHSIYFYTKDTGRPVSFVPPSFALQDITAIPRYRSFNTREDGCRLWWIEYGGRLDTVHDTERIKWELWKVVYGVWHHIKNSGQFPEAENLTLEWVGTIPGKRESRRFEGDFMLSQKDLVEQRLHFDAVSFGGWAIDLHPADGVFSGEPSCTQWHSKGVYPIPYRCMFSRNITNLFLAGRIISATHVAFGSTRVMATCAHGAQAMGEAAAICRREGWRPRDLAQPGRIERLQAALQRTGQFIPQIDVTDDEDLATAATVTASSRLTLDALPEAGEPLRLDQSYALLVPVTKGPMPRVRFWARTESTAKLTVQLRGASRPGNFTPDEVLAAETVMLQPAAAGGTRQRIATAIGSRTPGTETVITTPQMQEVAIDFQTTIETPRYLFFVVLANPDVEIAASDSRLTGVLALAHRANAAVSKGGANQLPPRQIGVDAFEFWTPQRRPSGRNFAARFDPPIDGFGPAHVTRGPDRPVDQANAWIASLTDDRPWVKLAWDRPQSIGRVTVSFDTDFDHPMESVLMGHPERVMPFCVRDAELVDDAGRTVATLRENHQSHWRIVFNTPIRTRSLRLVCRHPSPGVPASVFRIRCFQKETR